MFILFIKSFLALAVDIAWANTKSYICSFKADLKLVKSNKLELLILIVEFQNGQWDIENTEIGFNIEF